MICQSQRATPLRVTARAQVNKASIRSKVAVNRFHGFKSVSVDSFSSMHASVCRSTGSRSRVQATVVCSKVAVLGAAGGIGQPLSMLLKMNNMITDLALYDIANVAGVAADLSHCNTPVKVCNFPGDGCHADHVFNRSLVVCRFLRSLELMNSRVP